MTLTLDLVKAADTKAKEAASVAASAWISQHGDRDACGFAWVKTFADGRTKLVKLLRQVGFSSEYGGGWTKWNPSGAMVQSISALEVGARAYAESMNESLKNYMSEEQKLYMCSRMD